MVGRVNVHQRLGEPGCSDDWKEAASEGRDSWGPGAEGERKDCSFGEGGSSFAHGGEVMTLLLLLTLLCVWLRVLATVWFSVEVDADIRRRR